MSNQYSAAIQRAKHGNTGFWLLFSEATRMHLTLRFLWPLQVWWFQPCRRCWHVWRMMSPFMFIRSASPSSAAPCLTTTLQASIRQHLTGHVLKGPTRHGGFFVIITCITTIIPEMGVFFSLLWEAETLFVEFGHIVVVELGCLDCQAVLSDTHLQHKLKT